MVDGDDTEIVSEFFCFFRNVLDNLAVGQFECRWNNNVKHQVGMGRTEHCTKIMHAQIGINSFDNLINLSFQSIDFLFVGNDRVHVDD